MSFGESWKSSTDRASKDDLTGPIQDEQLELDENGLCSDGACAARPEQPGESRDEVDQKHCQIAHVRIVLCFAKTRSAFKGLKLAKLDAESISHRNPLNNSLFRLTTPV